MKRKARSVSSEMIDGSQSLFSFVLGIAGGSGSGKSTMARKLTEELPAKSVLLITHDSYYRDLPHLSYEERCAINFDHPDALETDLCARQLHALKRGKGIRQPIYDFLTHRRKRETIRLSPRPIIILEGILIFTDASLRKEMDLKLFLDAGDELRFERRLARDMRERGRTAESVRRQYEATVRPMYEEFVAPSARHADVILPADSSHERISRILVEILHRMIASAP